MFELNKCNSARLKESFFDGRLHTPLYDKGIKETQNKPMETTQWSGPNTRRNSGGRQTKKNWGSSGVD